MFEYFTFVLNPFHCSIWNWQISYNLTHEKMVRLKFGSEVLKKCIVQELGNLVGFMVGYDPPNYCGSGDIQRTFQNFKDIHTDGNSIRVALVL